MASEGRSRLLLVVLAVVLGGGVVAGLVYFASAEQPGAEGIADQLADRQKVLLIGERDLAPLAPRTIPVAEASEAIADALQADDASALVEAIRDADFDAILVDGRGEPEADDTMNGALRSYAHVPGLSAAYLAPAAAVYRLDEVEALEPAHADAMAHVARRIVAGDRPPRVASFPEPLRRVRNVEVMVLLRERGQARLWRSARGSSLARALVTASVVARQRWNEREQAMGGPLDDALPNLVVEVVRLSEDGTLGVRSRSFVERVFTEDHGVAYERRGTWHYQLPDGRGAEAGAAYDAYVELFTDNGLEPEALDRGDIRPYRLVATPLAVSAPSGSPSGDRGPSPDDALDDVLDDDS